MTLRAAIMRVLQQEDLNFLLTNRIPRRLLTQFMGWFSRIEHPVVRELSIGAWRLFANLDLSDAKKTRFASMHDCFTRELKEDARPIDRDPALIVSPCDGIVGACGSIAGVTALQIKGFPYELTDLLADRHLVDAFRDGRYVTIRLTSAMYHRFHAPHDVQVERVTYISGDTWNVNPIALKRIERLFCRNERAVLRLRLAANGDAIALVPVAAVLVAGIRLHFLDVRRELRSPGRNVMPCDAPLQKGAEMGWFEHGSTIIVFTPDGYRLCDDVHEGAFVRVGQALMRLPPTGAHASSAGGPVMTSADPERVS
jgi:phosphatidylserine decarboxylase